MKCPECGSEEFDYHDGDFGEEEAWQLIICDNCGYRFHAIYKFMFYEDRETGKQIEIED